jgi:hypothetical protein
MYRFRKLLSLGALLGAALVVAHRWNGAQPRSIPSQDAPAPAMMPGASPSPFARYDAAMAPAPMPLPSVRRAAIPAPAQDDEERVCSDTTVRPAGRREGGGQRHALVLMGASADVQVRGAALLMDAQIDRLAALAASSQDPILYAMALQGCAAADGEQGPGTAACGLLSRAQWARLDPSNALPWLALADEHHAAGDSAGEDDAMRHAAQAERLSAHATVVPLLVDRGLNARVPRLERALALQAAWRARSTWMPWGVNQARRYCLPDALSDADRRALCLSMAELLTSRGDRLEDVGAGVRIGSDLGWPPDRVRQLNDELDALAEAGPPQAGTSGTSCNDVDRMQQWMSAVESEGEPSALRRLLANAQLSPQMLGVRHRKEMALAQAAAAAAEAGTNDLP